jgi:demethoxyubiquinone hydroxylase (CLK1/Coq7/Cat5 family)
MIKQVSKESVNRYAINPDCIFNIIDIDEFRFAQKQSLGAKKEARNALKWTKIAFIVSVVFSIVSILISIFNTNTVSIEDKQLQGIYNQIDTLHQKQQEEVKNIHEFYQKEIEKLNKKVDSLAKLSVKKKK